MPFCVRSTYIDLPTVLQDQPYPPEHADLVNDIAAAGGAAITEMPFGWEPRARDFPRRNRLIAGVALGLVVIEAAERSGSLITARYAGNFGRQVFAVPGSPLDPRNQGTNGLLKDGAQIVTESADVIRSMAPMTRVDLFSDTALGEPPREEYRPTSPPPSDSERDRILDALSTTPVEIDEIIRHTGCNAQLVYSILLELDLAGRLHRHPRGLVSLDLTQD